MMAIGFAMWCGAALVYVLADLYKRPTVGLWHVVCALLIVGGIPLVAVSMLIFLWRVMP